MNHAYQSSGLRKNSPTPTFSKRLFYEWDGHCFPKTYLPDADFLLFLRVTCLGLRKHRTVQTIIYRRMSRLMTEL